MKAKLSLKTLYRSPVKTVLTFILLAAVTFALFSQVLEYVVAKRETEKAVELYDGVGSVAVGDFVYAESAPEYIFTDKRVPQGAVTDEWYEPYAKAGYESLSQKQIDEISALPYVTYLDYRYMTAGISEWERLYTESGYKYNNVCVVEATVKKFAVSENALVVGDMKLIGGEPIPYSDFGKNDVYIKTDGLSGSVGLVLEVTESGARYEWNNECEFNIGERYVFVLRYWNMTQAALYSKVYTYYLTDIFAYGQCNAVYSLKGESENYLSTERFAPLCEYIEIIENDRHTLDMVYTKNMNSIRYFAEGGYAVAEGRAIAPEDTENESNVCVIHYDFAQKYGLKVGDTVSIALGNRLFSQNDEIGAVSVVKERASTQYTKAELKIVGIYKHTLNKYRIEEEDDAFWSYTVNTFFVPMHLLAADEEELQNHSFYPGEVSFVVENAWDIPVFKTDVIPEISEKGYTVYFQGGSFEELLTAFKEAQRVAIIKIAILLAAVILITVFISILYIVGRKRDYAVMRLLGTSKITAAKSLMLPLGIIAGVAVITGSIAAYMYAAGNLSENASLKMLQGFDADISIPVGAVVLSAVCEAVLVVLVSFALLYRLGRKTPLELLQNNSQKKKARNKNADIEKADGAVFEEQWTTMEKTVSVKQGGSAKFICRYVFRHIRRTSVKALLFVAAAVVMLNLLGQLKIMKNVYIDIFESTEVTSQFAGFLNLKNAQELQKSGYVKDVFYKVNKVVDINREKYFLIVCNDPYLFAEQMEYENVQIEFIDGYDINSMHALGNVVIMGKAYMAQRGIELGDTVELSHQGWYESVKNTVTGNFRRSVLNGDAYSDEDILEIEKEKFDDLYYEKAEDFLVIGSISDAGGITDKHVYTPGSESISFDYGVLIIPESVSAVLIDNRKAEEYREYGKSLAGKNLTSEVAFVMDTSKLENVQNNIELVDTLFPIITAAVMVIGAFLCGLIIVQTSKDIAIMRVLGTSKLKIRTIIIFEQMILCVIGIIISCIILYIRGALMQMLWVCGVYAIVILLAAEISSAASTRKNVLELLQTKE